MPDSNFDSIAVSASTDGVKAGGSPMVAQIPVTFHQDANGVLVDASFFVADRAYTVVSISQVHATAATATATQYVQVVKDTGTQAPGAGTDLLTNNSNNGFTLNGVANTVQQGTLTTAAGALDLAAGDRLSADFTATTAPVAGVTITAMLKPKAS